MREPFSLTPGESRKWSRKHRESKPADVGHGIKQTAEYQRYIKSTQWRNIRADLFKLRGKRCERCGKWHGLEVHHETYERFGKELPSDLTILCKQCHDAADKKRRDELEAVFQEMCEDRRYEAARETYLDKVYGSYRAAWMDDEFDDWLERKKERGEWE
jgi:5-methylcytosine-specific restriction endonuclease McrA